MKAVIYLEGGGDTTALHARCQEGFHKLLHRMGFQGRKPRLVACGGRTRALDRFTTAIRHGSHDFAGLWIDSEVPMDDIDRTWEHLHKHDGWRKPAGAGDDQVLMMTTCMETWIVADRETLRKHYGARLRENALPPMQNLEDRPRQEIQASLERATADCPNAYGKGRRSFVIVGRLNPQALGGLPSFARVEAILENALRP